MGDSASDDTRPSRADTPLARLADIDARTGLISLALVLAVLVAALVGTAIATEPAPSGVDTAPPETTAAPGEEPAADACELGTWPELAEGPHPALATNPARGVYVWFDVDGWHVRNTSGRDVLVHMSIAGPSPLAGANSDGAGTLQPETLDRLLEGASPDVGIDVQLDCDYRAVSFELTSQGSSLPEQQIFLGRRSRPDANPFLLTRELEQ